MCGVRMLVATEDRVYYDVTHVTSNVTLEITCLLWIQLRCQYRQQKKAATIFHYDVTHQTLRPMLH